jgi:hypothetical protein
MQRGDTIRAVVMEVNLSIVGGKTCSIAIRSVEQAFAAPMVPILFLSPKEADGNLKRVMAYVKSSRCLAYGEIPDGEQVVTLLREMQP